MAGLQFVLFFGFFGTSWFSVPPPPTTATTIAPAYWCCCCYYYCRCNKYQRSDDDDDDDDDFMSLSNTAKLIVHSFMMRAKCEGEGRGEGGKRKMITMGFHPPLFFLLSFF